jgi:hypothetical protein
MAERKEGLMFTIQFLSVGYNYGDIAEGVKPCLSQSPSYSKVGSPW